jgi:hypothetical protein
VPPAFESLSVDERASAFVDRRLAVVRHAFHPARSPMFARLSGIERSRAVVLRLSALFALDSFGGGFVVQSFAAYWFYLRFGVDPRTLGTLFFAANVFARASLRWSPRGSPIASGC